MPATATNAAAGHPPRAAVAEFLEWHPTAGGQRPDADITVLMWVWYADGTADWAGGWQDGDAWRDAASGGTVTHWAEPEGPAA